MLSALYVLRSHCVLPQEVQRSALLELLPAFFTSVDEAMLDVESVSVVFPKHGWVLGLALVAAVQRSFLNEPL